MLPRLNAAFVAFVFVSAAGGPTYVTGQSTPIPTFSPAPTLGCESICANDLTACLAAAGDIPRKVTKCHLYDFDCYFLCADKTGWTCPDRCASDYDRCMIAEEDHGSECLERKTRCIQCCPKEPSESPSEVPTGDPTLAPTTKSPTKGPTVSPTTAPTFLPTFSHQPTMERTATVAEVGVPIYPDSVSAKTIIVPSSDSGVLLRLVKRVNDTMASDGTCVPTTLAPTIAPTALPTSSPTDLPTGTHTSGPSVLPSSSPTHLPTETPTVSPTGGPTKMPTKMPTNYPTMMVTTASPTTNSPTSSSTHLPTKTPTISPTGIPTNYPMTTTPTTKPFTSSPTAAPVTETLTAAPVDSTTAGSYVLLSGLLYDRCPAGHEVTEGECLAAANGLTQDMSTIENGDSLLVNDWTGLPCGCFIYQNRMIDFDTNCDNAAGTGDTSLVCKQSATDPIEDYILIPGGQQDRCPLGLEVPQEDCLAAGNIVTTHLTTINNPGSLNQNDWNGLPCGCYVWADTFINYDPNCANSAAAADGDLICKHTVSTGASSTGSPTAMPVESSTGYVLLPGDQYDQCPNGSDVTQEDCLEAGNLVTADMGIINRGSLNVADWTFTPCGCFIWDNQLIDFDYNCANKVVHPLTTLVCKEPVSTASRVLGTANDLSTAASAARALNAANDYILIPGGQQNRCANGAEVPQEDCLAAGNLVTAHLTTINNRETLNQDDWNGLPCGCYIWADTFINYDPNCANSAVAADADLVCKNITTTLPSPAPTTSSSMSSIGPSPVSIPAGRSYDGHNWESIHPLLLQFNCDEGGGVCSVDLPPDNNCEGSYYFLERSISEPLSVEREASRLLLQASFGPTQESLQDAVDSYNTTGDWIRDQMDVGFMPATLHREHYRRRCNSHIRQGQEKFGLRDPCDAGSRWNRWAFNRYRDVGKLITLQATASNTYIVKIDGKPRTEVNTADWTITNGGFFNTGGPMYVCRGMSEYTSIDGGTVPLANDPGNCLSPNMVGHLKVPAVNFMSDPVTLGLDIPSVSMEELYPVVLDVKLLSTSPSPCTLKKSWPNFVRDAATGQYYVEDRRAEMLELDPTNMPRPDGLWDKTCPSAPMTSFNQDSCMVRTDCGPPVYEEGTGTFVLDDVNIRKFYQEGGHYVYRIEDLPIITDSLSRWEMISPCNDAITFKRLDTDPFRFVRKNAPHSACTSGVVTDASIQNVVSSAIAAELSSIIDVNEKNNKRVLDIVMPKNTCNDPFKLAMGSSFNVYDASTGQTTCWTHSNPDEWSVFNMDKWTLFHPGNLEAHLKDKKNPIADFAEKEGSLEGSITLNMPSWHPDGRFPESKRLFDYVGNFGDTIDFASLPTSVQESTLASTFGAVPLPGAVSEYVRVCGSPGEVANDPKKGHQFRLQKGGDTGEMGNDSLDQDGYGWNGKNRVWNTVSTYAKDQLRQRVAWILSSLVVVTAVDINNEHNLEDWTSYHDIFVRHAFGSYFDILKEVSFHPLMATMLTYHDSRSLAHNYEKSGLMQFPDENYAREIMQLFSIGLYKLNQDGTVVIDPSTGEPAETYTNDDIMNFARAWTNFHRRDYRPNIEVFSDLHFSDNTVDPLYFPTTDGRDVFPKTGLDDGGRRLYIGDGVQRCDALPSRPWLRRGARYIFRGGNPNVELGHRDPETWESYPEFAFVILDNTSKLHEALCNANPITGECQFQPTVVLSEDVDCTGTCIAHEDPDGISGTKPCECSIEMPRTLRIEQPVATPGNLPSVWYEYVPEPCVQMAFPEPGQMKAVSEIGDYYGVYSNEALCADARLAVAGATCCDPTNGMSPVNICLFRGERTSYYEAERRCEQRGFVTCEWSEAPISWNCGTDITWAGDTAAHPAEGMRFSWTSADCSAKVQVNEHGFVSIVHDIGSLTQAVKGRVRVDAGTYFRALWSDGYFPLPSQGCAVSGCELRGSTCLCDTEVRTMVVFDWSTTPSKEELLSELHIGAPDPNTFDEDTYFRCAAPACNSLSSEYSLYFKQQVFSNEAVAGAINEDTIFELSDPITGETLFLTNTRSVVDVGSPGSGFSFRNPPMFNSPIDQTQRDALYETDAVLHSYVRHSNTAPFLATRLIQHLVTSNPSPRYVSAVSEAFRTGTYTDSVSGNIFGSQKYADLEATVAAVLLDPEARSSTLDSDPMHGRAREPLLKVIHFLRSLQLDTADGRPREVDMTFLKDKIGQESFYAPSVFSFFLTEYRPIGPVAEMGLVAPETQLYDAPKLIGYINALANLPIYGINDCEDGKNVGDIMARYKVPDHPDDRWYQCHETAMHDPSMDVPHRLRWVPTKGALASAAEIVEEMDLLLTGGRLSSANRIIIERAYAEVAQNHGNATALEAVMSHFAVTPEFQVTNRLFAEEIEAVRERSPSVLPEDVSNNPEPVSDYKALVYLYLAGGLDSYNLLMPNQCSNGLNAQYHQVRGNIAIANHMHLPISTGASAQSQPCSTFGIHPSMGQLQQMYIAGEASFIANVGPLAEPVANRDEFESGSKDIPPSLFAHNIQTGETHGVAALNATAGGVLGRIGDALNAQAGKEIFDAYSIAGTPKALEGAPGVSRPADVLTEVGVSTFTFSVEKFESNIRELNRPIADSIYAETYSHSISTAIERKDLLDNALGTSSLHPSTEACYENLGLDNAVALQFKQASRIIAQRNSLQSKRDVFYLQQGSYDAHGGTEGTATLLSMANSALQCFVNDMKLHGLWDKVTVMSASEFGRTLTSNGAGTDHAWGGNHFLAGGAVAGGKIHGQYPSDLSDAGHLNIGRGRVIPTTPWEGVWKGVAEWFGVEEGNMSTVLPNLHKFPMNIFGEADLFK